MGVSLGRETRHALRDPGGLAEPLEIVAQPGEGPHDVEVVDLDEVAPPAVEEDQLAQRERLEGAPETRSHAARRPRHPAHLAVLRG